jgi:phosphatidylserine/phosphatidylglycerophosphate/cardiolipin synthase-like enzyme
MRLVPACYNLLMNKQPRALIVILVCTVLMTACSPSITNQSNVQRPTNEPLASGLIHVYFTSPTTDSGCELLTPLLNSINGAEDHIQLAMYNLNLKPVAEALIAAQARGVTVDVVMDNDKMDNKVPRSMAAAGVPLVTDPADSTMHNKFMVIDGEQVWTGSLNYTDTGCGDDYNNLIQISSKELAQNYQVEFEEMFSGNQFSAESPANTPNPIVNVQGVQILTYFSPDDGVQDALLKVISKADDSIVFMAYSFTSDKLAKALIDREEHGVTVTGVMDAEQIQSNTGGEYERLREAGIPVAQDDIPGQMHHKVIIIDEKIVVTGSYNFSGNAEKSNDENVLILYSPDLAQQYLQEYAQIKTR